jgi:hypothetical protein
MIKLWLLLGLTLMIVLAGSLHAQTVPLTAPMMAAVPAPMDRIRLYDTTGNWRDLRFGPDEHHAWGFSPDGCRVLFTLAETGGLPSLYSARLDGSDLRGLVRYDELPAGEWGVWEPVWSPGGEGNGGLIAFTMIRGLADPTNPAAQDHHIGWINAEAAHQSPALPEFYSVTGREFSPQWSPNAEWLAYVSYDERIPGPAPNATAAPTETPAPGQPQNTQTVPTIQEADLWVVSADGVTKYRLTNFPTGSMRHPRWSPDSELIGFVYSPSANNDTLWMIANQQGALPTQLSYVWNLTLDHTWLPDGSAMLASIRDFQETPGNRLWRIPLVGNADNDATIYLEDPAFTHTDYPRFSADGRWLAFRSAYTLVLADTLEGTWAALDPDLPGNSPPVWSPPAFAGESACAAG